MDSLRRSLDDFKSQLTDITQLAMEADEASSTLVNRVTRLSGISSQGGIIRSIITRFSTGTGLFEVMQRLTSVLLIFRYFDKAAENRTKREQEFNTLMNKREDILKRMAKLKVEDLNAIDREAILQDKSIKNRIKFLGVEKSILKTRDDLERATKKMRRVGDKALRGETARFLINQRDPEIFSKMGITNPFQEESLDIAQMRLKEKEIMGYGERIKAVKKTKIARGEDGKTLRMRERALKTEIDSGIGTSEELRDKRRERDSILAALEGIDKIVEDLKNEQLFLIGELRESVNTLNETSPDREIVTLRSDDDKSLQDDANKNQLELIENVQQLGFFEKLKIRREKNRKRLQELLGHFIDKINKVLSVTSMMLYVRLGAVALTVFMYFSTMLFMLGGIVFALHQTGFFKETMKYFNKFQDVLDINLLETFIGGVYDFFGGLFSVLMNVINILVALFTGDSTKLKDNLNNLFIENIPKILSGLGKIMFTIGMTLVGMAVSAITGLISSIMGDAKSGVGKVGGFLGGAAGAIGGAKLGAFIGSAFGPVGTAIGYVAGSYLGAKAGGHVGVATGDFIAGGGNAQTRNPNLQPVMGYSMGGITPYSGTFLVGERGPELVSLPGNSKVFNNADTSRMMSPTININVTGRVGASDSELNDIARKIGQKINIEMNRYSSSGLRG